MARSNLCQLALRIESLSVVRRSSSLTSVPFILLYLAALGAFFLNLERHRWGSASWFPVAVGLIAAMAIIALRTLFYRFLMAEPGHNWRRITFFAFCAIVADVGIPLGAADDVLLASGLFLMSAISMWAALSDG
jgi:hypothetical protein